jgi:hypothetical protein
MTIEQIKLVGDVASVSTVITVLTGTVLPAITVLLSFVWAVVRLYETDTVQKWLTSHKGQSVVKEVQEVVEDNPEAVQFLTSFLERLAVRFIASRLHIFEDVVRRALNTFLPKDVS